MTFKEYINNPLRQLEMTIGFTTGILVGAVAGGVLLLFFTAWEWYFKLFSLIGSISICGMLIMSLAQTIKARRDYLLTLKEMDKVAEKITQDIDKIKEEKKNGAETPSYV
jgi:MFS family permease